MIASVSDARLRGLAGLRESKTSRIYQLYTLTFDGCESHKVGEACRVGIVW